MNEKEIKEKIGKENWKAFLKFMSGQTIRFKYGKADFYECDVENFMNKQKGRPTFFD